MYMRGKAGTIQQNRKSGQEGRGTVSHGKKRRGNGLVTGIAFLAGALAVYKRIPLTNCIGVNGNAYF